MSGCDVLFARRADDATLDGLLERVSTEDLSYPEVGETLGAPPPGYRHDNDSLVLGRGQDVFDRAMAGLERWEAHRAARVRIHPSDASIVEGTDVALALPFGRIYVLAACRIVAAVDEPNRFGFAYGTLPIHPERGEEAFIVERDGETVTFHVSAFSRPADGLAVSERRLPDTCNVG